MEAAIIWKLIWKQVSSKHGVKNISLVKELAAIMRNYDQRTAVIIMSKKYAVITIINAPRLQ